MLPAKLTLSQDAGSGAAIERRVEQAAAAQQHRAMFGVIRVMPTTRELVGEQDRFSVRRSVLERHGSAHSGRLLQRRVQALTPSCW